MKKSLKKDLNRRKLFKQFELQRLIYKSMIKHHRIPISKKLSVGGYLKHYSRNTSQTRIQNRCVISGRSKGVYKKFRLSRLCFREFASKGLLPGIKKASW